MSATIATRANMRKVEDANPSRTLPNGATILGRLAFAVSINNPEERASASSGDYWQLGEDEPLVDSEGEPMVLAFARTLLIDALTGEQL